MRDVRGSKTIPKEGSGKDTAALRTGYQALTPGFVSVAATGDRMLV